MDKRFFLALLLTGVVLVVTPLIFSPPPRPAALVAPPATAVTPPVGGTGTTGATAVTAVTAGQAIKPDPKTSGASTGKTAGIPAADLLDTIHGTGGGTVFTFSTRGAAPRSGELPEYRSLGSEKGTVRLEGGTTPLLQYGVLIGNDTTRLDETVFRFAKRDVAGEAVLTFTSPDTAAPATITYHLQPSSTLTRVEVEVPKATGRAYFLLGLPRGFVSHEADTLDDIRHLSYSAKPTTHGATGVSFSSLDPGERKLIAGPISWAVAKSKYFLVGVLSPSDSSAFSEVHVVGGARESKLATHASATVIVPLVNGRAAFDLYAGPQSWSKMHAIGREFETANPYGGFMQPVVQPFATIVMNVMLWMKQVVKLDYGWVLVIFGLAIRIVLWPLNQSAMRSSIRLQRIQPELTAVQAKYKDDRVKQQEEIMKVYQAHGMSPFSALSGCLPALIPMPVFFALFFVFQNTIEFRGVPFLWLADISLRDPLYILPIVTGASMFLLSWIGMRNMPKNPQATMMLYLMPGMFTTFLLSTASGLSLYYLVQQIAAIPQQWMIANERKKAQAGG
jgi:YidC/Oxa1 family membrane protein insertase